MNYGFIIDNRKCIGCHACTVACKSEHDVPLGVNRTWVKYIEKGLYPDTQRIFSVTRCNHCADAPCVEICPVTSLFSRADGIVDFDGERCIGCKSCMQACHYDALYIDPATHTSAKCNYCAHRVDLGLEPACVIVCPVHAIVSGDMDDPKTEIAHLLAREQVTVRRPEKHTRPKLFYIKGDEAALTPDDAPPRADYYASVQDAGVGHFAASAALAAMPDGPEARTRILGIRPQALEAAAEEVRRASAPPPRRTYDAPAKGVLWDWEVSGYLWTKSIAAGALFLPLLLAVLGLVELPLRLEKGLGWISLLFLGATGALLVKDLDRPERFLYVLLRPQWRSWLVRGAYLISGFGALSFLWVLHLHFGAGRLAWLEGVLVVLGALTAVYTAFLLAQAKGRDMWQSPVLPVTMLVQSAMAGSAVLLLLGILADHGPARTAAVAGLAVTLVLHLLLLAAEFTMPHVTGDAARAARLIWRGPLRLPFWSAVLLGNVLPLLLLAVGGNGLMDLPVVILVLTFALVLEHVWVRAPQLIPLR